MRYSVDLAQVGRRPRAACRDALLPQEGFMVDEHQVNSIIATAICDCRKDHPAQRMDPEEAKQMAKCIIEALTDAGLEFMPADPN
jgi:hypothetical protein